MKPISLSAVEYIALNMRESDRAEVYNMRGHDNPHLLAREVCYVASYGKAAIAEHRGVPCAIIGVSPLWPGVWSAWSFGTDQWRRRAVEISRYARDELKPWLMARNCHRLQCESHIDHTEAHRWLMALGAKPDGMLDGFGRDGSAYIMFSWSAPHVHRTTSRSEAGSAAA